MSEKTLKRRLSKWILSITGWKISDNLPDLDKMVVVVAPHTSNWDFLYGRCYAYIQRIHPNYMIKSELFFWPLGWLLKRNGGIPVYRKSGKNSVEQMVELIQKREKIILGIAPEGTRKRVEKWKTGFYYIAKEANIPLALVYLDYQRKEMGCMQIMNVSGNFEQDMSKIEQLYKNKVAHTPAFFNPKIF